MLTVQIERDLFGRQGKAITNFPARLPAPQSDLAQQSLKDPYLFDFLTLHEEAVERDLETGLVEHIQKFLVELGAGFAFVGRQVPITVGDDDDYLEKRAPSVSISPRPFLSANHGIPFAFLAEGLLLTVA